MRSRLAGRFFSSPGVHNWGKEEETIDLSLLQEAYHDCWRDMNAMNFGGTFLQEFQL